MRYALDVVRSHRSIMFAALVLAACSVSPELDPDGRTTTSPGSSSSTTVDDSSETSDAETTTEPVLDVPEPPVACDIWLQDCDEHEKCVPYASRGGTWDANKCVPILGDGQLGEPCLYAGKAEATDDCGAGLMCWMAVEVDGQLIGQCAALCEGDVEDPICPPDTACVVGGWGEGPDVCGPSCDVLAQDCPEGVACTWGGAFICVASGDVAIGQPCEFFDDCEAGGMCVVGDVLPSCAGAQCCAAFCDVSEPVCTTPGTECISFFEEGAGWDLGFEGICIDPDGP